MDTNITPRNPLAIRLWHKLSVWQRIALVLVSGIGALFAVPVAFTWGLMALTYISMAIVPLLAIVGAAFLIKKFIFG